MNEREWEKKLINKVKENHIWINAFHCINPTDEFKIHLAEKILQKLNNKDCLMCDSSITSDNKNIREISKLTPILFLSINKS